MCCRPEVAVRTEAVPAAAGTSGPWHPHALGPPSVRDSARLPAARSRESGPPLRRLFPPLVSIRFLQLGPALVAWKSAADVKASAGSPRPHARVLGWSKSPRRGDQCPGSVSGACVRAAGLLKDILSYSQFINFSLAAVGV